VIGDLGQLVFNEAARLVFRDGGTVSKAIKRLVFDDLSQLVSNWTLERLRIYTLNSSKFSCADLKLNGSVE